VEIKMYPIVESGWNMGAIYVRGKLIASGTKDRPIVFTSFYDGSNEKIWHWNGIVFENGAGTMTYCTVKFGGIGMIGNASPSIRNCYISDVNGVGIVFMKDSYGSPIIQDNIITNNSKGIEIIFPYSGVPRIKRNFIYNNREWGLRLDSYYEAPKGTLSVTDNWWGHPTGPYHSQYNPQGKGDKIQGAKVMFDPWIGKDFVITPSSGTVGSLVSIGGRGLEASIGIWILFGNSGTISWMTTNAEGSFTANWTVPVEKAGKKEIALLYPELGKGMIGKMLLTYFDILAEEIAYLKITPGSMTIGCGGSYDFEAQGYDKWGNPLANLNYAWQISSDLGTISPTSGYWTIFKAGTRAVTGTITATSGSITGNALITLSATPPQYPMSGTIVFLSGEVDKGEIWLMKADGSQLQKVNIQQIKAPYYPKLSKDAKSLIYGVGGSEWAGTLYLKDLMSGNEIVLQPYEVIIAKGWDWNTKGDRIYYHYYGPSQYNGSDNCVNYWISPDGIKKGRLLEDGTNRSLPAVNPDENLLLLRGWRQIRLFDLITDTKIYNERMLLDGVKKETEARFSPNGKRIGYIDEAESNLWLISIDGKINRKITNNGSVTYFSFSPDGTRLIYSRNGDLWTINIDGTGEQNITNTPDIQERQVDWVAGIAPVFSQEMPKPAPILIKEINGYPADLTGAYVYPNPTDGSKLVFAGLTQNVRIRVFTVAGEEVFEIDIVEPNIPEPGKWRWNCRGSQGQRLASGIYIYLITNELGQKKVGKLGIVR
ncbi:MAG: right-handed parallel beta-helix repeat-containing protein, partial [bacterium]